MRITDTTPIEDGYYMPAEYAAQDKIWMIWPERPDNWRDDAVPAQGYNYDMACKDRLVAL